MRRLLLVCVTLLVPLSVLCAQTDNAQKFKVTGSVVNAASGEPVRGAMVQFGGTESRNIMTGQDGHFEADGIPAGTIYVTAMRPGFGPPTSLQPIIVSSSTDPIVIKLTPLAKLSGAVTDRDGEAIEGVNIQCLHETVINGRKQWQAVGGTTSDDTGHFLIEDLVPGKYIVRTHEMHLYQVQQPKSEASRYIYPAVFYPDSPSRDTAQPVELTGGQEMKLDMSLRSIRAARITMETVPRHSNVMANLGSDEDFFGTNVAQSDGSGLLTFAAVPPGSWKIVVRGPFSGPRPPDEQPMYGEANVEVGSTDIKDVKIPLYNLPDIPVLVSGVPNAQVNVQLFAKNGQMHGSSTDQNGETKIPSVTPGSYRVVVQPTGSVCVTSIMSGSQDLLRDELAISPGGSVPSIQVVESASCGSIKITPNSQTTAAIIVTSSLQGFEPRAFHGQSAEVSLGPGEYKIYAFDDLNELEYANPDAMRDFKSQTVELEAGQKASVEVEVNVRRGR